MKDKYSFRCPHSNGKMSCPFIDTAGMDKTKECDICHYNENDSRGNSKIKEREHLLKRALKSIYPQVDKVFAVLNNYDKVPDWITSMPNVQAIVSPNTYA